MVLCATALAVACTLSSSLDDLKGNPVATGGVAGSGAGTGGGSGGSGGGGGTGGSGASGGAGGIGGSGATGGGSSDGGGADGSTGGLGNTVACEATQCTLADGFCCQTLSSGNPDGKCWATGLSCAGTDVYCDGPEDCTGGQKCCGTLSDGGLIFSVVTCQTDCTAGDQRVLCHNKTDCSGALECQTLMNLDEYSICI